MERLSKILINPEKVIRNEDLVNLRGGSELFGTCAASSGTGSCFDNLSRTEAIFMAGCEPDGTNCNGGHWCCDSCEGASWYPCQ
jgi:hypothetical protein